MHVHTLNNHSGFLLNQMCYETLLTIVPLSARSESAQVADVAESHLVRSANPGAHIFGNVVAALGHELAEESRHGSPVPYL